MKKLKKRKKFQLYDELEVAKTVVYQAKAMTLEGRRAVAGWLHQVANNLVKHGEEYDDLFTARYLR